jgi:hypothetical protein
MKINLDQYIISPYGARSVISRNIVQGVRAQLGRFLEQDPKTGTWYSISDKRAIEKTSHALSNMKYKTRKRHPDEPYGHHPGHIAYKVGGPFDDYMYDDDESEEDKILDTDSPNTVFAKKRTKKFRLIRRMDDDDDEEDDTLDGKESMKSAPGGNDKAKQTVDGQPITPPVPSMTRFSVGGKLISPNDSESREDFQEFQEQRNPNSLYRRVTHAVPSVGGMPTEADYAAYRNAAAGGAADIAPRLSQYENYLKNYAAGAAYKSLSYAGGMRDEYPTMRRYAPTDYGIPSHAAGAAAMGGHMMIPNLQGPPSYGAAGLEADRRRVLKSTGGATAGYWVRNEWVRMEDYY